MLYPKLHGLPYHTVVSNFSLKQYWVCIHQLFFKMFFLNLNARSQSEVFPSNLQNFAEKDKENSFEWFVMTNPDVHSKDKTIFILLYNPFPNKPCFFFKSAVQIS